MFVVLLAVVWMLVKGITLTLNGCLIAVSLVAATIGILLAVSALSS